MLMLQPSATPYTLNLNRLHSILCLELVPALVDGAENQSGDHPNFGAGILRNLYHVSS